LWDGSSLFLSPALSHSIVQYSTVQCSTSRSKDIVLTTSTMSVSSRAKEEESFSRAQDRADSGSDTPSRPFNSGPSLRTGTRGGGREEERRRRKGREGKESR
jgi:hypothetical protein